MPVSELSLTVLPVMETFWVRLPPCDELNAATLMPVDDRLLSTSLPEIVTFCTIVVLERPKAPT